MYVMADILESVPFQTASSPSPVTIRREYTTGNAKINQLDLINLIYISRFATVDNDNVKQDKVHDISLK